MARFSTSGMRYLGLGVEMAGAVGALVLAGWWVDRHWGTGPWGILIGALVGLVGGMTYLVREALGAARASTPGGDGGSATGSSTPGSTPPGPPRDGAT